MVLRKCLSLLLMVSLFSTNGFASNEAVPDKIGEAAQRMNSIFSSLVSSGVFFAEESNVISDRIDMSQKTEVVSPSRIVIDAEKRSTRRIRSTMSNFGKEFMKITKGFSGQERQQVLALLVSNYNLDSPSNLEERIARSEVLAKQLKRAILNETGLPEEVKIGAVLVGAIGGTILYGKMNLSAMMPKAFALFTGAVVGGGGTAIGSVLVDFAFDYHVLDEWVLTDLTDDEVIMFNNDLLGSDDTDEVEDLFK